MKKVYTGKTKDVYELPNGNYLLQFKDDCTGKDGKFDPGENQVGLKIKGIGQSNLKVTIKFFELLKSKGIKTHYASADADKATMEVVPCKPFGKGLEVICRRKAVGSFVRRYASVVKEGLPLDYLVEMTLKDDERGDPLINEEALIQTGMMTKKNYKSLSKDTKKITKILFTELSKKGLELIDIKFEFGITDKGKVLLIDEIASGNMRVFKNGKSVDPVELSKLILKN